MRKSASQLEKYVIDVLTPREDDVFQLVIMSYSAAEIGDMLNVSVKTVETHIHRMKKKLHCKSRSDLFKIAVSCGRVMVASQRYLSTQKKFQDKKH